MFEMMEILKPINQEKLLFRAILRQKGLHDTMVYEMVKLFFP